MDLPMQDGTPSGAASEAGPLPEAAPLSEAAGAGNPHPPFIWTSAAAALAERARLYLAAGCGLELRGPPGSGKSALAAALAGRSGRRAVRLRPGDAGEGAALLALACAEGALLLVDEAWPRLSPLAARLAAVLDGGVLPVSPDGGPGLPVHPEFRAIVVTTGPDALPPALCDRLVTLELDGGDREGEVAIAAAHSGRRAEEVAGIVDMVRDLRRSREYAVWPSLRCSIRLCRLASALGCAVSAGDRRFVSLVADVLGACLPAGPDGLPEPRHRRMLEKLAGHFCGEAPAAGAAPAEAAAA